MPESQENYRKPQSIKNRRRLRNSRRFKGRRSGQKAAGAKSRLRRFRQATFLAVVITTLLLLVLEPGGAETVQNDTLPQTPDTVSVIEDIPVEDLIEQRAEKEVEEVDEPVDPVETVSEAWMTIRELVKAFYRNLPRFIIALLIIVFTYFLTKGFNYITKKTIGNWERSHGIIAVVGVFIWLIAISIIFGVLSGDIRALIGSLGLVGLALSWALQTPIESFTGWLLNSFQGYYRIGDRIVVGEVFGDVYKIDFLTTTVWEVGAPYLRDELKIK
ncbi:MAG: mechanosensitive ion channel family protein, partial [Cytophagaceae bacterium]